MLHYLKVENLALIETLSLEFSAGFTAVTGETGAGKSVLLGALALLSGCRADKALIRTGAETAQIEAALNLPSESPLHALLETMDLPACEEDQLLLRRSFSKSKPARIHINGSLATLAQLREISPAWVDFHGPGEPQKLFHETEQLRLLDLFAGLRQQVEAYARDFNAWKAASREITALRNEEALTPETAEFLRRELDSMDSLQLSVERIEELEANWQRISNSAELKEQGSTLANLFLDEDGLLARLQGALPAARKLAELDPQSESLADRLESLLIEANDLGGEFASIAEGGELDAAAAHQIEAEMETWLGLQRKYGPSIEAVVEKRDTLRERLDLQGNLKEVIAQKEAAAAALEKELRQSAAKLRSARLKAAHQLSLQTLKRLQQLGFKKPGLEILIEAQRELGPQGDCSCSIQFAPNPGQPPMPLKQIASSGEMARVMLALKSILAEADATPVLVFDEVDANIGGEVAVAVAKRLAQLGKAHQVFCITHLPQVAATAHHHFRVRKEQTDASTSVTIEPLANSSDALIDELARMLGDRTAESARQHAAALLESAAKS